MAMQLKPFQVEGVRLLREILRTHPGALLADDMGLGKTVQAAEIINQARAACRVLVVCPASVVLNWRNELRAWCPARRVRTILDAAAPARGVFVVNYDRLDAWAGILERWAPGFVVADESHYLKNHEAARTKAFYSIPTTRRLFLSGTPALNRPRELWTTLRACGALPKQYAARTNFGKRYCAAYLDRRGAWDDSGASNLDELREHMARVMVRREKSEVLKDLPPKTRQIIPLSGPAAALRRELAAVQAAGGWDAVCSKLEAGEPVGLGEVAKARHELGLAKVKAAIEHVKGVLESEPQVVVFAHHRAVLQLLEDAFAGYGCTVVHGGVQPAKRQAEVERFQRGDARVFLGQIQAAGVGLTLTAARVAVFVEPSYVPAELDQAEDRLHRIGQTDNVLIQYLVFDGSLDARMLQRGNAKRRVLGEMGL